MGELWSLQVTLDIVEHFHVSVLGVVAVAFADWGQSKGVHLLLPVDLIVERLHLVGILLHAILHHLGRLDWGPVI